jgi:hypothetical protein
MQHAQEILRVAFVPHDDASIVLQPRKQPFHLRSASIPAERATILRRVCAVPAVRRDEFYAALREFRIELVGLVRVIPMSRLGILCTSRFASVVSTSVTSCGVALSM